MAITKKDLLEFGEILEKKLLTKIEQKLDFRFKEQDKKFSDKLDTRFEEQDKKFNDKLDTRFEEQNKRVKDSFVDLLAKLPDWSQFATKDELRNMNERLMRVEDIVVSMNQKLETDIVMMQDELSRHSKILAIHSKLLKSNE